MNTSNMRAFPARRPGAAGAQSEPAEPGWRWLWWIAGVAALLVAMIIPIQLVVFVIWPPPLQGNAEDWFSLFQRNRLVGLLDLDLLLVADNVLGVPILLALYALLRRQGEAIMALAAALGFIGIIFFITSNPAIEMLSLSDGFAAAATDAERANYLAAGHAMLAIWQGTTFHTGYILSSIAWIAIPVVMLREPQFGKAIPYLGIVANVVGLGLYLPVIGLFLALLSVVVLEGWYILLARQLFRLAQSTVPDDVD